ncbi:signal transduction histidine kinase [Leucobacter exalbidus]|uniref:histidine kinase n=1 Tax=Leucobacter exalbidus TaxID=662960 RepID=A0A940PVJ4_9MICO|nr:HAMP domain-containing sensor histidine kinase [Leucobacter exalbidus]MBP1326079.1 signal transduction histidine kinase [Leucobacter exalbidus]
MRARLLTIFLAPLIAILVVLGGAYAWTSARSIEQEFMNQQLDDLSYFLVSARQGLVTGNTMILEGEMTRYSELYGGRISVVDHSGALIAADPETWAHGHDESNTGAANTSVADQVDLALSGRRAGLTRPGLPWATGPATVVEPVIADGKVLGAVLISSSLEIPRAQMTAQWLQLLAVFIVIIAALVFVILRLVRWVLRPMLRVDQAMVAIEHGEMGSRIADDTGPPEMQRMIRIFNSMAEEIERVIVRQQEFAMNASHELRNPLGALLLRMEYLATGLDESWDDDVEKAREEGQRMARILETLLTMARSQRRDSPFAVVDLGEVGRDRVDAWQQVADDRRVTFSVHSTGGCHTVTDRTAVESALDAVIDNALKFAPPGSTIDVSSSRKADGFVLTVRDRGPGLADDEIEHVTERFWRSARDQNIAGSGLGLAIANDLLHTVCGSVQVTSPVGGGLQVSLLLPEEGA